MVHIYIFVVIVILIHCFSYAVIAAGCASCPKIKCERPGCDSYFCYHCKAAWHPNQTCDSARAKRSSNLRTSSIAFSIDSQSRKKYYKYFYFTYVNVKNNFRRRH